MARVLLTGATGFVGGRIATRLAMLDHPVVAPVRRHDDHLAELGVELHLGGFEAVAPALLADIEVVVHAAATAGPDLATAAAVNVEGTRRLRDAAVEAGTPRFVHVSTTSVYADPSEDVRVVDEDAPLVSDDDEDASPYARTKASADRLLLATQEGPAVAILRPPAVLGAGPTSTWGTRVPTAIAEGRGFPAPRGRSFAFVHVEDLVDAIETAAALDDPWTPSPAGPAPGAPLVANVVGGHVTVADYLDAVVDLLPGSVPERPGTDEPAWTGRYATDRLPRKLGLAPHRSFRAGMAEIADAWTTQDQEEPR
ncbi:MAG: NAD(P)-dependent oxidoreductase [Nitriliruptor sp.]|nr:MAG: NAD(P)-dependent oxidoreductase [Nitriliruptor sp.]